ncbi:MAG: helix-turn-helix transcriptional regulator [Burkholderiales bacterium]|nr:helix-turn-helix transcriptional regulator [Burkholderiales bacterium]
MLTGSQIRGARAMLGWTIRELAAHARMSVPTVQRLEQHDGVPPSRSQTLLDLKAALEQAGIAFTGTPEEPGVALRRRASP